MFGLDTLMQALLAQQLGFALGRDALELSLSLCSGDGVGGCLLCLRICGRCVRRWRGRSLQVRQEANR